MELTVEPNVMRNPRSCVSVSANTEPRAETTRSQGLWRPWNDTTGTQIFSQNRSSSRLQSCNAYQGHISEKAKIPAFQHPVKLCWPKSQCYDFLYQEAEGLLRNFPVQATIAIYQEWDSDSDPEEDEISDN